MDRSCYLTHCCRMTCDRRNGGGGGGAAHCWRDNNVECVWVGVSSAGSGRGGASVGASSWSPRRGHRRAASRRDATTSSSLLFSSRRCYDATPWLAGWRRPSARLVATSPDHNSSRLIVPRFDALCPVGPTVFSITTDTSLSQLFGV